MLRPRAGVAVLPVAFLLSCSLLQRAPTLEARRVAFEPRNHAWTFQHMSELFPTRTISRGGNTGPFPRGRDLPVHFSAGPGDAAVDLDRFFERNYSRGMLVLHRGTLVFERYAEGADATTRFTSWSVAKSFTSTLVGLAIGDGDIHSVHDRLATYIPELAGTAYENVTIEQALQMSSGVKFSEVYEDGGSDVFDFLVASMFTNRKRANLLAASYPRRHPPGTVFNYNTAETQILGWLVRNATGRTPGRYLQEKLWEPLGMEHDASWVLDREGADGMEMTGCCLNMSLHDWARFGQLMAQDGIWDRQRILPAGWVAAATIPSAPHVAFGKVEPPSDVGYQYQWWAQRDGTFSAEGVYGQFIYVNAKSQVVIAKASTWPQAWDNDLARDAFATFHDISAFLDQQPET
jgi:CubicO group peptidase (beta-lactamase class C family)